MLTFMKILCLTLLSFVSLIEANMPKEAKIWVAGSNGFAGSALVRHLKEEGYHNLILKTRKELDLCDREKVFKFYQEERPEYVFVCAAKVGGILANSTYPADFIYDNLAIEQNVIHGAYLSNVKKLVFLGSSCIYPKFCPQPIKEEYLLTSDLEPTNEWYAIAKIAGLKLCQAYNKQYGTNYISLMPTNLYGIGDNFDLKSSHVVPALIRKFVEAKRNNAPEVPIWGSGNPMREFLYVDDLARACLWAMNHYQGNEWLNVGTGKDIRIGDLAKLIAEIVGYKGTLVFDSTKPDGTPKKLLDVSKIHNLGWHHEIELREGLTQTIQWYESN